MHLKKLKPLCVILLGEALLTSCAVNIPNIRAVAPVEGIPGIAAIAQETNTDKTTRLTIDEWLDFLYAQLERPDPKDPTNTLPEKGPAICMSSEDWAKNETAIAQLCVKGKCTYEQTLLLEKARKFRTLATNANINYLKLVRASER